MQIVKRQPEKYQSRVQIVLDGMTASGKTTTVELLSHELGLKVMPEEFRDQYDLLRKFAYDSKWCMPMQLNFLTTRYCQYMVASESNQYILDRSIYSDQVYAEMYYQMGYLREEQYNSYLKLYHTLLNSIQQPQCLLFLTCSFETVLQRVKERGRAFEIHQGEKYWRTLYDAYGKYIEAMQRDIAYRNLLVINTDQYNLKCSVSDQQEVVRQVKRMLTLK